MRIQQWAKIAGALLLAGSAAWFAKLAVIVGTDGRVIDSGAAAWLMNIGLVCLVLGTSGLALWITRHHSLIIRSGAVLASPVAFLGSFLILDAMTKLAVGNADPAYLHEEAGIAVAATIWLMLGAWLRAQTRENTSMLSRKQTA